MFPLHLDEVKEIKETLQILESKLQDANIELASDVQKQLSVTYFNVNTLIDWLGGPQVAIMEDIEELNEIPF